MAHKLSNSIDGIVRLNLSIQFRLSLEDLATYATVSIACSPDYKSGMNDVEAARGHLRNQRTVLKYARTTIEEYGTSSPHYRVGDDHLRDLYEAVLYRVRCLWVD